MIQAKFLPCFGDKEFVNNKYIFIKKPFDLSKRRGTRSLFSSTISLKDFELYITQFIIFTISSSAKAAGEGSL